MKGKQLAYAIISIIFFAATGVVIFVNLSDSSDVPAATNITESNSEGTTPGVAVPTGQSLLPYGADLNFSIINGYNNGLVPQFPYEQVTAEQVGLSDPNQLVKPDSSLQ